MEHEPVDKNVNINISLENTMRLLKENANDKVNEYFFAVYDFLEQTEDENSALRAENQEMKNTIETLKEVIKALTHQHQIKELKGEN